MSPGAQLLGVVLVAAGPVRRHARFLLAQHGEDLFDLFVVDHLAQADALGVVCGDIEDQVAVGQAEHEVLPLLAEGDLGLTLLDDCGPMVGVHDFVSDLEHGSPLHGHGAGPATVSEVPHRSRQVSRPDGSFLFYQIRPLIRTARRCWPRPCGPARRAPAGPWPCRCPRPTPARPRVADMISGRVPKRSTSRSISRRRQLGQAVQEPVAPGGHFGVELVVGRRAGPEWRPPGAGP